MKPSAAIYLILGAVILTGLFVLLRPEEAPSPPAPPKALGAPIPRVFELKVERGQRVSGPAVIQVRQGEQITLKVTSDRADELHLHGYDLSLALPAGEPAQLNFRTDRSGRFEYELHHAHQDLGVLEVLPR
jgi:hypothetical protein